MKNRCIHILLGLALVFPFIFLLALSFFRKWRFPDILPGAWTEENWLYLFSMQGRSGWLVLGLSLLISLLVAGISTISGFLTSRFIAWHKAKQKLLLCWHISLLYFLPCHFRHMRIYFYFIYPWIYRVICGG